MSSVVEYQGKMLIKLDNPFTMIVSGQTGSGKTNFVTRLIRSNQLINKVPFQKIVYAYSILQDIFLSLAHEIPEVDLHEGFPGEVAWTGDPTLLILDDMMFELRNDVRLAELFTKMRHKNVSTVFITQNMYFSSQYATTITRNAQYLVLFPNPRDNSMIEVLGRQTFPLYRKFLSTAFSIATEKPYGYLFFDFKPATPKNLRVRQDIFPGEQVWVYVPKP